MSKKPDKFKIFTRIIALIMAILMVAGMATTLLFYIFAK